MRLSLGYPDMETEAQILRGENPLEKVERLKPVVKLQDLASVMESIRKFYVSPEVAHLAVEIAHATRQHPGILLGVSTRGLMHLINCAKAMAFTRDRDFVVPEDILELAPLCLSHRIITREGEQADEIMRSIVEKLRASFKT
ncbi:AAA family ATPase [Hydrogenobacter sp. Uz 6-8]